MTKPALGLPVAVLARLTQSRRSSAARPTIPNQPCRSAMILSGLPRPVIVTILLMRICPSPTVRVSPSFFPRRESSKWLGWSFAGQDINSVSPQRCQLIVTAILMDKKAERLKGALVTSKT